MPVSRSGLPRPARRRPAPPSRVEPTGGAGTSRATATPTAGGRSRRGSPSQRRRQASPDPREATRGPPASQLSRPSARGRPKRRDRDPPGVARDPRPVAIEGRGPNQADADLGRGRRGEQDVEEVGLEARHQDPPESGRRRERRPRVGPSGRRPSSAAEDSASRIGTGQPRRSRGSRSASRPESAASRAKRRGALHIPSSATACRGRPSARQSTMASKSRVPRRSSRSAAASASRIG